MLLVLRCMAVWALTASAQTPQAPSFEVASVKPAAPNGPAGVMPFLKGPMEEQVRFQGGPGSKDPGRIDYVGVTLKMLLKRAYDVSADQISGPDWLDTERYDIVAKVPPGTSGEQLRLMLQELLTERFQISLHRETKTLAVYSLTVAKNGPKLKPAEKLPEYKDDEERKAAMKKSASAFLEARMAAMRRGEHVPGRSFHMASATMAGFATWLSSNLDRPVKDKTQLDGIYSFSLTWEPDDAKPRGDAPLGPSLFAAVEEQLGLKLQRENEQVELLAIDKAQKVPTSN
ncbi:MAG: TIGR03435 family protein [Candidatus Sulfopaludibacter sp.]|nr:TIGR03435 family protein [Candidatus Sulfopaludibacter sp.]